jgi:small-conductance mechanosensitive channel
LRSWADIDVSTIVLALAGAWLVAILSAKLVRWLSPRVPVRLRYYLQPWPPIIRLIVIVAATAVVIPLILVPSPEAMFALAGSGAVALGFAFKDYVSSLIAGVVVLFERPCSVGDWVRVGGVYGRVTAMRLRVIELVTPDDDKVSIPLSTLWAHPIHNANAGRPDLMCVAEFFLDPQHDPLAVHRALEDVGLTSAHRNLERPVCVVAQEELFGTRYRLKAYPFDGTDQFAFITDMTLRGKQVLQSLGALPARAALPQPSASVSNV